MLFRSPIIRSTLTKTTTPLPFLQQTHLRTMSSQPLRYKLVFFTPPQSLPDIKAAIFAAGAGTYPNYSECCFTTPGVGQFRPGDSANPAIGSKGQLEEVGEVKCETVCNGREITEQAVAALKK